MKSTLTTMRLEETDYELIEKIKERTGITMNKDVVRFALRICVRETNE